MKKLFLLLFATVAFVFSSEAQYNPNPTTGACVVKMGSLTITYSWYGDGTANASSYNSDGGLFHSWSTSKSLAQNICAGYYGESQYTMLAEALPIHYSNEVGTLITNSEELASAQIMLATTGSALDNGACVIQSGGLTYTYWWGPDLSTGAEVGYFAVADNTGVVQGTRMIPAILAKGACGHAGIN